MKFNIATDLDASVFQEEGRPYVILCKSTDVVEKEEALAVCMQQRTWEKLVFYISTIEMHLSKKHLTMQPLYLGDDVYASYGIYKDMSLVHIRRWGNSKRGFLFPTKTGVVFNEKAWSSFKQVIPDINRVLKDYMESGNVPYQPLVTQRSASARDRLDVRCDLVIEGPLAARGGVLCQ